MVAPLHASFPVLTRNDKKAVPAFKKGHHLFGKQKTGLFFSCVCGFRIIRRFFRRCAVVDLTLNVLDDVT